jgi:hypothetical protein
MKAYGRIEIYSSTIFHLGTGWRWVVSIMRRLLNPQEKGSWYPLDRSLGGPQSQSWCCEEDKNLALVRNWTPAIQLVTQCYTDWAVPTVNLKWGIYYPDWGFSWFSSVPLGTCWDTTSIRSWLLPSNPPVISHPIIRCYTGCPRSLVQYLRSVLRVPYRATFK